MTVKRMVKAKDSDCRGDENAAHIGSAPFSVLLLLIEKTSTK